MLHSRRRSRSRRSPIHIKAPPPSPVPYTDNKLSQNENKRSPIVNTIIDGFAWGTGSTIARRIFGSEEKCDLKMDSKIVDDNKKEMKDTTDELWLRYNECIKTQKSESKNFDKIILEEI